MALVFIFMRVFTAFFLSSSLSVVPNILYTVCRKFEGRVEARGGRTALTFAANYFEDQIKRSPNGAWLCHVR